MIGKALKYMRTKKKLNQKELKNMLNIGQSTLSDYENEKISINFETLEKIANICNYKIFFVNEQDNDTFELCELERKDFK